MPNFQKIILFLTLSTVANSSLNSLAFASGKQYKKHSHNCNKHYLIPPPPPFIPSNYSNYHLSNVSHSNSSNVVKANKYLWQSYPVYSKVTSEPTAIRPNKYLTYFN